jgi:TPR repeat protein
MRAPRLAFVALLAAAALAASRAGPAQAADVGGWMEQKSRADRATKDECPALIALAARTEKTHEGAAAAYYAAGLCYLHGEAATRAHNGEPSTRDQNVQQTAPAPTLDRIARDPVAAQAWLTRAAELEHPLARRALLALREASAGNETHAPGWHCHDLGLGRRICHGGASPAY